MNDPGRYIVQDRAMLYAWAEGDPSVEAQLWAFADELADIVFRAPADLDGLIERMVPAGAAVQAHAGDPCLTRSRGLR